MIDGLKCQHSLSFYRGIVPFLFVILFHVLYATDYSGPFLDTLMSASSKYPEGLSSSPASWVVGVDRLERGGISALSCYGCIEVETKGKQLIMRNTSLIYRELMFSTWPHSAVDRRRVSYICALFV